MELEGWFLHKIPYGETSFKLTLFTKEQGMLGLWHKGGRLPKKQALLRPFMPLWLSVDLRREQHYLRQLEGLSPPLDLKQRSLFSACYINELLYYMLKPGEAFREVYEAYEYTLQGLCTTTLAPLSLEALLRRFEWVLLRSCGYGLALVEGGDEESYHYVKGQGFVATREGGFSKEVAMAICSGQFVDFTALKSAKIIMRQAIDHMLDGRQLHSRGYFRSTSS